MLTQRRRETAAQGNGDSTVCGEGRAPCHRAKRKSGGRRAAEGKVWAERGLGRHRGERRRGSHPRSLEGLWRTLASRGRGSLSIPRASAGSQPSGLLRGPASPRFPGDCGRRWSPEPRVLWAPVMPLIHGRTLRASPRLPCLGFRSVKKESGDRFTF